MYENELSSMLKEHGADIIGFSDVSSILPEELSEYPYAVTIVRRLSRAVVNTINGDRKSTRLNSSHSV